MFRVGIIGSENSHAMAFSEIFNINNKEQYPDIQVVAIYGEDQAASEAVRDKCGVEIMTPEEMLGKVDAVMVTSLYRGRNSGICGQALDTKCRGSH